jgi:hypothetical protein
MGGGGLHPPDRRARDRGEVREDRPALQRLLAGIDLLAGIESSDEPKRFISGTLKMISPED